MTARRRRSQSGAVSLEWVGLGGFLLAALAAASAYAGTHLGDTMGQLLISHIKAALGG